MSIFRFRLQPVLNLREQLEKSAMNDYGGAVEKYQMEKAVLDNLHHQFKCLKEQYNSRCKEGLPVYKVRTYALYNQALNEKAEIQEDNVNKESQNVDKRREELIHAMKEKKIIEKLKNNRMIEHKKLQQSREQKDLDEVVSYKHAVLAEKNQLDLNSEEGIK